MELMFYGVWVVDGSRALCPSLPTGVSCHLRTCPLEKVVLSRAQALLFTRDTHPASASVSFGLLLGACYYLFIYLAASGLSWSMRDLLLWCRDSLVVARGLTCSTACRVLVPQPGVKPKFPTLQGRFFFFLPLSFFFFLSFWTLYLVLGSSWLTMLW